MLCYTCINRAVYHYAFSYTYTYTYTMRTRTYNNIMLIQV